MSRWSWSVVVLAVALFLAAASGKKHRHDGEFENFAQAVPVAVGAGHSAAGHSAAGFDAGKVGVVGAVGVVGKAEDDYVDFDPRLPDPPCLWTAWSQCDAACGGGSAYRLRRLTDECAYGPAQQLKVCNAQPCPQDCVLGEWTAWGCGGECGGCSSPCGGGERSRQRAVLTPALFGGSCGEAIVETEACNAQPCPMDCIAVTEWSNWQGCSAACGGGRRSRQRRTQLVMSVRPGRSQTEADCPESVQEEPCNLEPCPIDCVVDELTGWSQWTLCSATCGTEGTQVRHREITTHPQNSGAECPPVLEIRQCDDDLGLCPDDVQMPQGDPIILPPLKPAPRPLPAVIESVAEEPELTVPEGFCEGRADGPYEHPECPCCNDLIFCFQRGPMIKWCPPGEVFVGQWAKCAKKAAAPNC